jgi:hypothetical protein
LNRFNESRLVMAGLFAALTATNATAQTTAKTREVNNCFQAQAAYGNDIGACLIILYKWDGTDARAAAVAYEARRQRLEDSLNALLMKAYVARIAAANRPLLSIIVTVMGAQRDYRGRFDRAAHSWDELQLKSPNGYTVTVSSNSSRPQDPYAWSVIVSSVKDESLVCTYSVGYEYDSKEPSCTK